MRRVDIILGVWELIFGVNCIYECYLLVRERCKRQMRRKIKLWNMQYVNNCLNIKNVVLSFNSWLGHIRHANSYNLINYYRKNIKFKLNYRIMILVYVGIIKSIVIFN